MERLFTGLQRPFAPDFPAMNVWTNEEHAIVTAELPGVAEEDIDVSVTGSTLTLRGERKAAEGGEYHRQEREEGSFVRTLDLPFQVNASQVEARLARGVLHIKLPRAEEDKPRKIAIQTA